MSSAINLSQLAIPDAIESVAFDNLVAEITLDLMARAPELGAALTLPSEPITKMSEAVAYRELIVRTRINELVKSRLLAYATNSDLDHIGAGFGVDRLIIAPADSTTTPPTAAVMESDEAFRSRVQLSVDGHTTAGSVESYVFHALSAHGSVKDVQVLSPVAGQVDVYVLSHDGIGVPTQALMDAVYAALTEENVRPLTDFVRVLPAEVIEYQIDASLMFYSGPDSEVVRQLAEDTVRQFVTDHHALGHDIRFSGLYAALHRVGVQNVQLFLPETSLIISPSQAAFCNSITVRNGGVDE